MKKIIALLLSFLLLLTGCGQVQQQSSEISENTINTESEKQKEDSVEEYYGPQYTSLDE